MSIRANGQVKNVFEALRMCVQVSLKEQATANFARASPLTTTARRGHVPMVKTPPGEQVVCERP